MSPYLSKKPPTDLQLTQEWFAKIITKRLTEDNHIQVKAPSGAKIEREAAHYILPGPKLRAHERIQIYNQQYWWRLLKVLQESFPLVTRLFGPHDFNETIAIPYLLKYPPNHWSLNLLGERLPLWIDQEYHAKDRVLVQNSAQLDWAFCASFVAEDRPPLNAEFEAEQLLTYTFYLQPHIFLFEWNCDLFTFRNEFLKEGVEYWIENNFPALPKGEMRHFMLSRSAKNFIQWKEISLGEYVLLQSLQKGSSIESACERLEQDEALYEQATQHLQTWLQEWVSRGWLTLKNV
jgi:hypothetical protein